MRKKKCGNKSFLSFVLFIVLTMFLSGNISAQEFIRGDLDCNGIVDDTDLCWLNCYYYMGPTCGMGGDACPNREDIYAPACDINDDGLVTLTDWIILFSFLDGGGLPPAPPYPDCGVDPTNPQPGEDCCGAGSYICGNANSEEGVNVSDAVYIINYTFVIGAPAPVPIESCDANCDGSCNVSDAVFLINYVFVVDSPEPCDPDDDGIPDC